MRIQELSGGLASQVFQYVFARFGELSGGEEWYMDDSSYYMGENRYNGYELYRVFGLRPRLLSETLDPDTWKRYIDLRKSGKSMPQILLEEGHDIAVYTEKGDYSDLGQFTGHVYHKTPEGGFYPDIATMKEAPDIYYHGHWVDKCWFNSYREILLKELQFPPASAMQAIVYDEQIKEDYAVAVHIRRGDFVDRGIALDTEYYNDALKSLSKARNDYKLYVFSDDLYWCNQHSFELGIHFAPKVEYVSGNSGEDSYTDLYLMSKCDGIIMANSAFSYLAALLNEHLDFFVEPKQIEVDENTQTPGRVN